MLFYQSCLGGDLTITRLGDTPMKREAPPAQQHKVACAQLRSDVLEFSATDWLHPTRAPKQGNTVAMYIAEAPYAELRAIFDKLAVGAGSIPHRRTAAHAVRNVRTSPRPLRGALVLPGGSCARGMTVRVVSHHAERNLTRSRDRGRPRALGQVLASWAGRGGDYSQPPASRTRSQPSQPLGSSFDSAATVRGRWQTDRRIPGPERMFGRSLGHGSGAGQRALARASRQGSPVRRGAWYRHGACSP